MKKFNLFIYLSICIIGALTISSCNKEDIAYQPNTEDLNPALYPGNFEDLVVPTFTQNTNTDRNVLIEDFTGSQCTFCPYAADDAHNILLSKPPGRVFIASIHSGPNGQGSFQMTGPDYPEDFTNPQGLEIGIYFGTNDGGFSGNPRGAVSRAYNGGNIFNASLQWSQMTDNILNANNLKVNLQAQSNYYASTRGYFLFTEVDILDNSLLYSNLAQAVYFIEDSLVGDQKMPDGSHNDSYLHRDIMRGCIDGNAFGRTIKSSYLNQGTGKYELYYSYKIPDNVTEFDNHHVLIYVYDKITLEIYQVIEHEIQ